MMLKRASRWQAFSKEFFISKLDVSLNSGLIKKHASPASCDRHESLNRLFSDNRPAAMSLMRGAGFVILLRIMLILLMIHLIPSARLANVVGPQQCTNGFVLASYHSDSVSCKTSQNVIYDCRVSKCFATSDTSQHGKPCQSCPLLGGSSWNQPIKKNE
ncbi:hypothetical protein PGTUg99_031536 [Puccinia graminis f. sp. tritici]|uniref:Uncharacterized protein n=1 Tax=Puccinia graminis f. sp. tritici TaxID=56615 RepID=A0A5B0NYS2_PUCGR|nr:hypothetical protein PGTUg99_031536 [Puccinia graminis f. sp. tritici]